VSARGLASALAALAALTLAVPSALAQTRPGLDCNLYGPTEPCEPYLLYPPGQDLRLTIRSRNAADGRRGEGSINTLRELFAALRACWRPPAADQARPGMELTVRFSFKRDGSLLGTPRFTYMSRAATPEQRDLYRRAVLDSLSACAPYPLTRGLGGAVAGRPIVIRYIDDRNTLQTRI
jgi:hypothetical protein